MSNDQIEIIRGDNRETLLKQVTYVIDGVNPPPFEVTVKHPTLRGNMLGRTIPLNVSMIGPEDGSGNRWIIEGSISRKTIDEIPWLAGVELFRGYYESDTHTGGLKPMRR